MKRTCDIAIAATEYDSAPLLSLRERLAQRLPSCSISLARDDGDEAASVKNARVVVLLHGWMWARTDGSRAVEAVLAPRVAREGAGFLVVLSLDDAPLPQWAESARTFVRGDAAQDLCLETIIEAARANGAPMRDVPPVDHGSSVEWENHARQREAFFATHRAVAACDREFRKLVDDVTRRAKLLGSAEVQTAPGRCVVQLGDVALTMSWIRGRTAAADGRLMIVEWQGQVQRGSRRAPERTVVANSVPRVATVRREHVMLADATREDNWRWRRESFNWASYSPEDLAAACVESLAASRGEVTA